MNGFHLLLNINRQRAPGQRMTAADVRKHVMTGSLMMLHPGTLDVAFPDGSSTQTLSLVDVVDPVDVEEAFAQRRTSALYDISSTTSSPRKYQQFSSADAYVRMLIERPIIVRSTPRPIFEADAGRAERVARSDSKRQSYASTASSGTMGSAEGDSRESRLHQSQPDPTIPGVIQRSSFTQLDLLSDARRQAGRQANLVNLLPVQNDSSVIEKRSAPPYPEERVGQKLIVKVLRLSVDPFFEPLFGSIAIYDAKAKRKVTENFYFDVNPEEIRRMVDKNNSFAEATDRCSQAAFSLSCPLTDLFIVIKLEKVLQACEIIDASEPYTNCAARDERTREKLAAAAADFCDRLGSFRMPLGFMVLDLQKVLMGVNTLERSEMCMSTMTTGSVGTAAGEADRLSDEDLYKLLADARRPGGKLSRLKTFAVDMGLQLSGGTGEELLMRLSPEMLRVAPFSGGPGTELTKDIQEFPAKGFYMANTSYRNLLYIYPKSANLTNRPGTARNISVKVELMNAQEQPLRVLYSRGAGSDMVSVARTAVIYHNKTPHITDEIKLRIPVDLDDGHHLLFTFYHISCKANNKDEETEYPIGYSCNHQGYQYRPPTESKARSQLCKDMAAEKNKPGSPETQKLYHIIGLFSSKDAFSLMDRSYVMGLVRDFNRDISHRISCIGEPAATTLMLLKLDFVRI
ncbi:hypothetical protein TELCIR_14220, partial [Teladorsagia circumcincta]